MKRKQESSITPPVGEHLLFSDLERSSLTIWSHLFSHCLFKHAGLTHISLCKLQSKKNVSTLYHNWIIRTREQNNRIRISFEFLPWRSLQANTIETCASASFTEATDWALQAMVHSKNLLGGGQWRHRNSFNRGILYCEVSGPKELLSEEIGVCHGIKAAIYSRLYPSKRQSLPLCTTWSVCLHEWIPVLKQLFQKRDDEVEGENVSLKIWSRAVFAIHLTIKLFIDGAWCMAWQI